MNYCSQCAAPLPSEAKFCSQCAAPVEKPPPVVQAISPLTRPPVVSTTLEPPIYTTPASDAPLTQKPVAPHRQSYYGYAAFATLCLVAVILLGAFVNSATSTSSSTRPNIGLSATEAPKPTVVPTATPTKSELLRRERQAQLLATENREAAAARGRKLRLAISKMRSEKDEVTGITWYEPQNAPESNGSRNALYLYFGEQQGTILPLRLKFQYAGENWVFIKEVTIKADNQTFTINPEYDEVKHDNAGGQVWEWYDHPATDDNIEMAKAVINAKQVIIRFGGDQNQQDYYMPDSEQQELRDTLDAHSAMEELAAHPEEARVKVNSETVDSTVIKLRKGMEGASVKRWQDFLIEQGIMEPPALGDFGERTYKSTMAFQQRYGLIADGTVGPQTLGKARELGYIP